MGRVKRAFGFDMGKWCIKRHGSRWFVMPPAKSDDPQWWTRGGTFKSGAEALAAFAAGGQR